MNRLILFSAAASMAISIATTSHAQTWNMPLAYAATNYHSEHAAKFAAEVTANSDLEIKTHPGGSLFSGGEIFGAVRRGLAPIGERLISALSNEDPIYEADSVPFLATGFEGARTLYEVSRPALEETLNEAGLHFLYSCPWPPQGFYSVRDVTELSVLQGMKFRAYNATTSRIAEGLGMVPTTIEAAELSQAFATGVAESMISSGSTGYDRKLWEHVDYFYDVQAWLPRNMVIVNQSAWDGLDDETRAVMATAAAKAEVGCWSEAEERAGWYIEQFREKGMKVGVFNDAVLMAFRQVGAELRADWLERAGERGRAIVDALE